MTELPGRDLLRAWRAETSNSQADLAKLVGLSQPAVAQWERAGRPALTKALELQTLSNGKVPASAWGYTEEEIARVFAAFGAPPAPVVPSATATAIDGTPSLEAEHDREPATRTRRASTSRRRSVVDPRAA